MERIKPLNAVKVKKTLYFEKEVAKQLKMLSAETGKTESKLANDLLERCLSMGQSY